MSGFCDRLWRMVDDTSGPDRGTSDHGTSDLGVTTAGCIGETSSGCCGEYSGPNRFRGMWHRHCTAHLPRPAGSRRSGILADWPSREIAEEKVLEKCLQFFDEPCALIAADDDVTSPGANGVWPVSDAPRVRYAGVFNPERIPAIRKETLLRPEVAAYATLAGAKAVAFHATGILTLATGAANQRAAEEKALKDCNADPRS